MNTVLIFAWVWTAMIATGLWESSVEGRNAFAKGKTGWKLVFGKYLVITRYHFFLFYIMWPMLLILPLIIYGWDNRIFGVLMSAYFSGQSIEDFSWYVFNTKVKIKEFWSPFSDYFIWFKIKQQKILPWGYLVGWLAAIVFWFFLWR